MRATLLALSMAVVALQPAAVAAQGVVQAQTEPVAVERASSEGELPVSLDRIKRALSRAPPADGRPQLLDFTEFVVVVGKAPEISLFGDADLSGGPARSIHADMMAATRPSKLDQAVGSDVLGVATASLFALIPPAIRTVAGWFSGDENQRPPGSSGYTEMFLLESSDEGVPTANTLQFHRLEGQRVALHASVSDPQAPGFAVTVDGQAWRTFHQEVADHTIPNELLLLERVGNIHHLTISQVPGTHLQGPLTIGLLVVVHEVVEP